MLKIRLKRYGQKKAPHYKIGIMVSTKKRNGLSLNIVGFYNPHNKNLKLDIGKITESLTYGTQPTSKVKFFLKQMNIIK
jgi:small subunit ribosomal protein S16